ncbi:anhydro-N-acetylmuramic acid kinase [Psychrobium sp. nBUS_13]|uniref:anhydro-N-acetylmuramic acid kinase n=1 Tax=Psychrobium sp. nBUS_13 TaxID=3395319 RepID=UPI003EBD126E
MIPQIYIGLMSGTSMDGVDAVLVDFSDGSPKVLATHDEPIPNGLLTHLHRLADPKVGDINLLGECDRASGELFATAVNNLVEKTNWDREQVIAIGSHGQTVRHMPNLPYPFSLQIGDASTIAVQTQIDTVADFRRKDIALGGQGAPLVPAFHRAMFGSNLKDRVILNIGGIANITWLAKDGTTSGFDTGPGNTLLDLWYSQHHDTNFDRSGLWGATGEVNNNLLTRMLSHPYFAMAAPKSTGRELFNASWLNQHLSHFPAIQPQDVQATLAQLTAQSIALDILTLSETTDIFVCGGGLFNDDIINKLQKLLPKCTIQSTAVIGIEPQWVEAIAFAWLAFCFVNKQSSNLPAVTGAKKAAILGAFYPAI